MTEIQIRTAQQKDADSVAVMLAHLAHEIGDGARFIADEDIIRRFGFGNKPHFHCLIAAQGGTDLGLAVYYPVFSTTRGKPGVYVLDLWISENARGLGLGSRLLSAVAVHASDEWEAGYLSLTVYADNTGATEFYRRLGFCGDDNDRPMALDGNAFDTLKGQI